MKILNKKCTTGGFSLMEILIVLALIGLIMGLVISNHEAFFGSGQKQVAKLFVSKTIEVPLTAYRIHTGSYPTTEEGLEALLKAPSGKSAQWQGPYVKELPQDPWGHPYQYRFPGSKNKDRYDVWSMGSGGKSGDEDDIGNW
jgi:general secretion pathway protein G